MDRALLAFCSTSRTVVPPAWMSRMMPKISSTSMGARPSDGSSSSIRIGSAMSARPIASICCSPPLSVPASCDRRSARMGKHACTRSSARWIARLSVRAYAPILRFSRTVSSGKSSRPSGTCEIPRRTIFSEGRPSILRPRKLTVPRAGRASPEMLLRVVDLPAPLAPSRVTMEPSSTLNEMPLSAWILP